MAEKKKILLVEDDVFIKDIYFRKFSSEGFELIEASDGEKALRTVNENLPDLVMLDLNMPIMDGFTFLKNMKKNDKLKDIIVVILSNFSDDEKIKEAKKLGVEDYIVKSNFTPTEVVDKIKAILIK